MLDAMRHCFQFRARVRVLCVLPLCFPGVENEKSPVFLPGLILNDLQMILDRLDLIAAFPLAGAGDKCRR
jgi:hypothetical protein